MAKKKATSTATANAKTAKKKTSRKKVASEKPAKKRTTKKKSAIVELTFGFGLHDTFKDNTLFLMPMACPFNGKPRKDAPRLLRELIRSEMQMLYENAGFVSQGLLTSLETASEEGRILWGWSPWRAKENCLTWRQWEAFCEKWCGTSTTAASRPSGQYGSQPQESIRALCEEIATLAGQKKLKLISNWPHGCNPESNSAS